MKLKQCSQGHFYDEDRYGNDCPHCKAGSSAVNVAPSDKTVPVDSLGNVPPTVPLNPIDDPTPALQDDEKTISYGQQIADVAEEPVVGWLVCIKGNNLGRDFRLHAGRNFIGRGSNMDVCLSGDASVSRNSHAIIVYDPKSGGYLAQPGESRELFYLNGKVVLASEEVQAYDVFELGESSLLFIPLCGKEFDWNKLQKTEGGE
ncbi:MAG: FHA domain-containing protein [Lachnospiraceae bacterium]|nr:FHA domain-containing protein [Lachnospiraceae bacterium]